MVILLKHCKFSRINTFGDRIQISLYDNVIHVIQLRGVTPMLAFILLCSFRYDHGQIFLSILLLALIQRRRGTILFLVVVDWISQTTHLIPFKKSIDAIGTTLVFKLVARLHRLPHNVVSNRDGVVYPVT